jgi:hypothetical protein
MRPLRAQETGRAFEASAVAGDHRRDPGRRSIAARLKGDPFARQYAGNSKSETGDDSHEASFRLPCDRKNLRPDDRRLSGRWMLRTKSRENVWKRITPEPVQPFGGESLRYLCRC